MLYTVMRKTMTDKLRLAKYITFDTVDKINYYDKDGLRSVSYLKKKTSKQSNLSAFSSTGFYIHLSVINPFVTLLSRMGLLAGLSKVLHIGLHLANVN